MLSITLALVAAFPSAGAAQPAQRKLLDRFSMRMGGGVAFFVSRDQLDWLGFKRPGFLADLSFSLLVRSWLSAELGGTIGLFMAGAKAAELQPLVPEIAAPGGLLAPWLGLRHTARVAGSFRSSAPTSDRDSRVIACARCSRAASARTSTSAAERASGRASA